VIIDDLHIVRFSVCPNEADAPLVVDPDAVLSNSISPQPFKPVSRGSLEFLQSLRAVQIQQFSRGLSFKGLEATLGLVLEQVFGVAAAE
jgi:hypothetical protein